MDWRDMLFGRGALQKAAQTGDTQPTPQAAQPAGIDVRALAQAQADQQQPHMGLPAQIPAGVRGAPYPLQGSLSEAARKRGQESGGR